jgi:ABC-2 type transport system permease protein
MSWLLRKDLRVLGRSRLLVALLVLYPVAIALLIGFALSRGPARPRVAIVDETPPGATVNVGGRRVEVGRYARRLFSQVQSLGVPSRAQAIEKVRSAQVIAAVVIPPDIAAHVASGTSKGEVELIYNGDALEQSLVQSQLGAAIAQANLAFSEGIQRGAADAIELLLRGGDLTVLGAPTHLIGLSRIPALLHGILARQPPGADRASLRRIADFADFAAANLSVSKKVLSAVGQPIAVRSTLLHGRRTPLSSFAVVVAVSISLMFVCVLLGAGGVALEREEHTLGRLLRGLVSAQALLVEKAMLAASCSLLLGFALLAGVSAFVPLSWGRAGQWLLALAFGAVAFGALGVAIGAVAREVRAASLLAFLLSLPLAFLALVPAGAVSRGLYEAIGAISFAFPFKSSLQALDTAVNGAAPSLLGSLVHLAALTLLFGALARLALRRAG